MKNNFIIFLIKVVFLFTFIFLLKINLLFAETEPNNSIQQANPIILNSTDKGMLFNNSVKENDLEDYYKVELVEDGALQITTISEGTLINSLTLFDTDAKTPLRSLNDNNKNKKILSENLMPGIYYIHVKFTGGFGNYTISTLFTTVIKPNDTELNDDILSSSELAVPSELSGRLGYYRSKYTDNHDWWKFTIISTSPFEIKVIAENSLVCNIYLIDTDGKKQIRVNNTKEKIKFIKHNFAMPGTYYLHIERTGGFGTYTISSKTIN